MKAVAKRIAVWCVALFLAVLALYRALAMYVPTTPEIIGYDLEKLVEVVVLLWVARKAQKAASKRPCHPEAA